MKIFPASDFRAFIPKDGLGLRDGIELWSGFLRRAESVSEYFTNMMILDEETGLKTSPLVQFEEYVKIWEMHQLPDEEDAFSALVSKDGNDPAVSSCRYQWGKDWAWMNDHLEFTIRRPLQDTSFDVDLVRKMYSAIIRWRRPSFIHGGPPKPMAEQGVFSTKISSGWASWVPEAITHADLPMAHSVDPLEGGSLIFATPEPFGWRMEEYSQEIARMQDVEVGLNDLLLLPPYDMPPDWTAPHRAVFR
ncbi:hypothetical protein [Paracoccus siganidrum]|nr:hypothetical protein [Paracoccus siganidrum]